MPAFRTGGGAGLLAVAFREAVSAVTDAGAAVHAAGEQAVAREAAGDISQVTGDVVSLLMVPHAPLLGEVGTRRAFFITVTVVEHWMITFMSPGAKVLTLRRFGATGYGWIHDRFSTVASQFIKAGLPARQAVPTVTEVLAAVKTAVELVATDEGTAVRSIYATKFVTLVPTTGPLLAAALLAGEHQLSFILYC